MAETKSKPKSGTDQPRDEDGRFTDSDDDSRAKSKDDDMKSSAGSRAGSKAKDDNRAAQRGGSDQSSKSR